MKKIYLFLSLTAISLTCRAETDEDAYIRKYAVDPEIAAILDAHHDDIARVLRKAADAGRTEHTTWNFPWLPNYMVKLNIKRITGMERIKKCIEEYNLDLITVPDKRLYHIKGRPTSLSSKNYLVVVKMSETDPHRKPLSLRHMQQIITLMKKSTYISFSASNYIRTYHDKIVMIDTESNFDIRQLLSGGYIRLIAAKHDISRDFTKEALQYLLREIAIELHRCNGSECKKVMSEVARYLTRARKTDWDYMNYLYRELERTRTYRSRAIRFQSILRSNFIQPGTSPAQTLP